MAIRFGKVGSRLRNMGRAGDRFMKMLRRLAPGRPLSVDLYGAPNGSRLVWPHEACAQIDKNASSSFLHKSALKSDGAYATCVLPALYILREREWFCLTSINVHEGLASRLRL
eukprot:3042271-Amphidinium_carterae.1